MVANGSSRPLSYRFSITTSAVAEGLSCKGDFSWQILGRRRMQTRGAREMKLGTSDYVNKDT